MATEYWTKGDVPTFVGESFSIRYFLSIHPFNIELDEDVKCMLIKFVNGTKLGILHTLTDSRIVI